MSYSTKANTLAYDAAYLLNKPNIDRKDDYSYIQYWREYN